MPSTGRQHYMMKFLKFNSWDLQQAIVQRGSSWRRNAIARSIYDVQLLWHVGRSWIHISRQNSYWPSVCLRSRGETDTMRLGSIPWSIGIVLSVKDGRNHLQNKRAAQLGNAQSHHWRQYSNNKHMLFSLTRKFFFLSSFHYLAE